MVVTNKQRIFSYELWTTRSLLEKFGTWFTVKTKSKELQHSGVIAGIVRELHKKQNLLVRSVACRRTKNMACLLRKRTHGILVVEPLGVWMTATKHRVLDTEVWVSKTFPRVLPFWYYKQWRTTINDVVSKIRWLWIRPS